MSLGLSLHEMASQFERYQEMSALSARMVDAARTGDWDGLILLEQHVAQLRDDLIADGRSAVEAADSLSQADRLRGMIQQILEDDAEIRRHTEPWMENVRMFLSGHMSGWRVDSGPTGGGPRKYDGHDGAG